MNFTKIIALIFFTIFLCACGGINKISDSNKIINREDIKIEQAQSADFKVFHGLIKSQQTTDLSFQTEGKIIFIPYTKGDFVKKGQVLARLDGILYKIRKNEEQAQLQNIIIQYNRSKSSFKRMDVLHQEGAISDNDWEAAYFDLKSHNEQIRIQKEKISYLDKEISYNILTAPYDGFIVQKMAQIGTYAKIGEPVLVISGSDKTQIEIMVDSSVINRIKLDEEVEIERSDSKFKGKITHISKTSLGEGGYLVKIYLNELAENLKDGMSVEVKIPFNDSKIVYVPLNSVFEENNQKFVYKISNIKNNIGEIKKEKITTGQVNNEKVEILSGLKVGEYVVVKGLCGFENENKKIKI